MKTQGPFLILAIHPRPSSTQVGLFENEEELWRDERIHLSHELKPFHSTRSQIPFRLECVRSVLQDHGIENTQLDAVVARGGLMKPLPGGTYEVNETMVRILEADRYGTHVSNVGAPIAYQLAKEFAGGRAFVVDPIVVDELMPEARYSGFPELPRKSVFHALVQKDAARRAAKEQGKDYTSSSWVVAHLGPGISVGAHFCGRVIDVNNALDGEGPFSPERSGALPAADLARLCFSGVYDLEEILRKIVHNGGLFAYLKTSDPDEISRRILDEDHEAALLVRSMGYRIACEIASRAASLFGHVDGIVLVGPLAAHDDFINPIVERVSWIAPIKIYPGENELGALSRGALRVLIGSEKALQYQ